MSQGRRSPITEGFLLAFGTYPTLTPHRADEKLAWAAGLFDGEGNTCAHYLEARGEARIRCQIGQAASPEVLHRFKAAVGAGCINGPYQAVGNRKPNWTYATTGLRQTADVLAKLWPYLSSPKRDQALKAFRNYKEYLDEKGTK